MKKNSAAAIFGTLVILVLFCLGYSITFAAAPPSSTSVLLPALNHLLLSGKGSLSGLVWYDEDGDQTPADEFGAEGIRVFVDVDGNGVYSSGEPFAITDIDGIYSITGIRAGTYNIYADSLPSGFAASTDNPLQIVLAKKQKISAANFGIQDFSGSITGYVWNDSDANGVFNYTENPIDGVDVYLDLNSDNEYTLGEPRGTTNASGYYIVPKLARDTYSVHVDNGTLPLEYHRTTVSGSNPSIIYLSTGRNIPVNFGYQRKATISGILINVTGDVWANVIVFIDLNGNGVYDAGEPIAETDANGQYKFDNLLPGTYTLLILDKNLTTGYDILLAPMPITVTEGENYTTAHFLTQAVPVTIEGYVWNDRNANRKKDTDETGLSGVTIFLDTNGNNQPDPGELKTFTDSAGYYSFTGLDHGKFYVRIDDSTLLDAYIPTTVHNLRVRNILPGQTYDGARFGYQSKLEPKNSIISPVKLSWGSDGNLYVSDSRTGSVFIYDSSLTLQGELKNLAKPLGIATDDSGNIYVGSLGNQNVEVYSPTGNLLKTFADGYLSVPNDIALDSANNVYILDSSKDSVLIYDKDGAYLSSITDAGRIGYGVSIAISYINDPAGELYLADQENCKIHIYSLGGSYKKSVGGSGIYMLTSNWDGLFSGLMAVDIDPNGYIHGLDNNLNVVQVFDPVSGSFLYSYDAYPAANALTLNLQSDLSINPVDTRVIITNAATRNIETVATLP